MKEWLSTINHLHFKNNKHFKEDELQHIIINSSGGENGTLSKKFWVGGSRCWKKFQRGFDLFWLLLRFLKKFPGVGFVLYPVYPPHPPCEHLWHQPIVSFSKKLISWSITDIGRIFFGIPVCINLEIWIQKFEFF